MEFTILTKLKLIAAAVLISLTALPFTAAAQDYDKGLAAAHSGDYATALKEFKPLAEQGDANAQYDLGVMYAKGMGVPQDFSKALGLYILAAEQGNASAQYSLGQLRATGKGIQQDYTKAMIWFKLAAEQGFATAQHNLAWMYDYGKGEGVPQDYALAHMWYNIAAANGGDKADKASKKRDDVAAKMTAENIAKAQSMAKECMASGYKDCGE